VDVIGEAAQASGGARRISSEMLRRPVYGRITCVTPTYQLDSDTTWIPFTR
jgi:hypothetical protein